MAQLKFNLSFKQKEYDLYEKAVLEQRSPGTFIKDAIEFYLKYGSKSIQNIQIDNNHSFQEEREEIDTNDLLDL